MHPTDKCCVRSKIALCADAAQLLIFFHYVSHPASRKKTQRSMKCRLIRPGKQSPKMLNFFAFWKKKKQKKKKKLQGQVELWNNWLPGFSFFSFPTNETINLQAVTVKWCRTSDLGIMSWTQWGSLKLFVVFTHCWFLALLWDLLMRKVQRDGRLIL